MFQQSELRNMYKILIAEDEPIIRESLAQYVDWSSIGVQVVGTTANGQEALDRIINGAVDLIISDIKMPIMDGITLAEKLDELGYSCRVILISAYSDFQYAKSALQQPNIDNYILKPVQPDKLLEAVAAAISHLQVNEKKSASFQYSTAELTFLSSSELRTLHQDLLSRMDAGDALAAEVPLRKIQSFFQQNKLPITGYQRFCSDIFHGFSNSDHFYSEVLLNNTDSAELQYEQITDACLEQITKICQRAQKFQSSTSSVIPEAILLMQKHYQDSSFNLLVLADLLDLSPNYLSSKFKQETGQPFSTALQNMRLEKVKDLLRNTPLKIYEIADQAGFRDVRYLTKIFREKVQCTPSEYRANSFSNDK